MGSPYDVEFLLARSYTWIISVVTPTREGQDAPPKSHFSVEICGHFKIVSSYLCFTMPDTYGLGNRPVVRKLSATSNDLFKKFGERTTSSSADSSNLVSPSASSSGTTTPSLLRSRPGSIKKVRTKAEVSRRSG